MAAAGREGRGGGGDDLVCVCVCVCQASRRGLGQWPNLEGHVNNGKQDR